MKHLITILLLTLACLGASAQSVASAVCEAPDQPAQFPGGQTALMHWLAEHISYPQAAAEEGIQGKVVVRFVVTETGSLGKVELVRGSHPALDKEALRVVRKLPKFIPGQVDYHPVSTWYTLPVNFRLN